MAKKKATASLVSKFNLKFKKRYGKYLDRIDAYMLRPMMIDLEWGLMVYLDFVMEMKNMESMGASGDLAISYYRRMMEQQKPELYDIYDETTTTKENPENIQIIPSNDSLEEFTSNYRDNYKNSKTKLPQKVAILNLKGTMLAEGGLCTRSIDSLCKELRYTAASDGIKGVVLNTHSGGGEVTAAQRLANAIKEYKKSGKPIIQYIDGISASGAVFAGVYCDEIMGGGRTISTGSIGVVSSFNRLQLEYFKKYIISIYADGSEDKHEIIKSMMEGNHEVVKKKSLNPIRQEFARVVKQNRTLHPTDEVDVSKILKGGMFKYAEARKYGLVDGIGTRLDAIRRVNTLANQRYKAKAQGARTNTSVNSQQVSAKHAMLSFQ